MFYPRQYVIRYRTPSGECIREYIEIEDGVVVQRRNYALGLYEVFHYEVFQKVLKEDQHACGYTVFTDSSAFPGYILAHVTHRRPPIDTELLPLYSQERDVAFDAFFRALDSECEALVRRACPADFEDE